jgi:tRNA pseudouridine13 synthase
MERGEKEKEKFTNNQKQQKQQKTFNFDNPNKVNEEDVGIECYINNIDDGFECIIKHRYSDFIVNEINENGDIIWLIEKNKEKMQIENFNKEKLKEISIEIKQNTIAQEDKKVSIAKESELNLEKIEEIILNNFKSKILDEEDSEKLKELLFKYINR